MKKTTLIIICLLWAFLLSGCSKAVSVNYVQQLSDTTTSPAESTPNPTPASTEDNPIVSETQNAADETVSIVVGFGGDIMMHKNLMTDVSYSGNSFDHWFDQIGSALSYPDIMVVNLEGPLAGTEHISYGYPAFNFPDQICDSFVKYGVDVVLNGNNHIFDWWAYSAERTIDKLDEYDLKHTGVWAKEDAKEPLLIEANGIKIGILNPTEFINGYIDKMDIDPAASMVVVSDNYDEIGHQIDTLKDLGADIIIASPHMGEEFTYAPSEKYIEVVKTYLMLGADAVVAHHPHTIQKAEEITVELEDGTEKTGIVYFSIGNIIGDMFGNHCETGVIAYLNIEKNITTGETKIISSEYLPICTMIHNGMHNSYYVIPLESDITDKDNIQHRETIISRINSDTICPLNKMP